MKKLLCALLAAVLLLCLIPTAALADDSCANGHTPDLGNPHIDPECNWGVHFEHYTCTQCYESCYADGTVVAHSDWEEGVVPHTLSMDVTEIEAMSCYLDTDTKLYLCEKCETVCDQDGYEIGKADGGNSLRGHNWVLIKAEDQNINSCCGWCEEDFYICTRCSTAGKTGEDSSIEEEWYPDWLTYPEDETEAIHKWHYIAGDSTRKDCWKCLGCHMISLNAEGTKLTESRLDLLRNGDTDVTESEDSAESDSTDESDETVKPSNYAVILEVSINPEFTIYIDKESTVLAVDFMNEDAQSLKSQIRTSDCTADECIADIIAAAEKNGFFGEAPAMSIKIIDSKISETELNTLLETIKNVKTEDGGAVNIMLLNADGSEYIAPEEPDAAVSTAPNNPTTGDIDILPMFLIMLCSGIGLLAVIFCNKKKLF